VCFPVRKTAELSTWFRRLFSNYSVLYRTALLVSAAFGIEHLVSGYSSLRIQFPVVFVKLFCAHYKSKQREEMGG
jgi:hypothetical protein